MPSIGQCSECFQFVRLTKAGNTYRHGSKSFADNRLGMTGFLLESGFTMEVTRGDCHGSGKPPQRPRAKWDGPTSKWLPQPTRRK